MTWEIAVVIVGLAWAAVVLFAIRTERDRETASEFHHMRERLGRMEKETEWLGHVVREQVCKSKGNA